MIDLVNVVVPVFNGERVLAQSIHTVVGFLESQCPCRYELVIANNGSTDSTLQVAQEMAAQYPAVKVLSLAAKGRGRAVKTAWRQSAADVLNYMDVDLSSDLTAYPSLIAPLIAGTHDLAIGSRLLVPAMTRRSLKREVISRAYNVLVKLFFRTRFSDAQCGFKAITRAAAAALLPQVEDDGWFMDTELLVLAEKLGYRIFDLPVAWNEDPDSRVRLWSIAATDIAGLIRLRGRITPRRGPQPAGRTILPGFKA